MLTIDIKSALLCLLIIAAIILVIYLIVAAYNLIKTLKKSQQMLDDFEIVAKITSKRTQQIDNLIEGASKKIKSGQGIFNSIPIIISAIANIAKIVGRQSDKKAEQGKKQQF